jgi:3-deoxy-manno-octulosonate cytidylyltransferase (CMP-KDO synthetase)
VKAAAIIPARWGSTRFEGKPLVPLAGRPMIQHVWEKACAAEGIDTVVIATDDDRIADAARQFGAQVSMTRADHACGSDRISEVAETLDADIIVNVQGDEPLVRSADLARLAAELRTRPDVKVASLCHPITREEAANPNRVKVVCDAHGDALYFSRAAIPHPHASAAPEFLQHAGIYAYRRNVLLAFSDLPVPAIERLEALEQLRFLNAKIAIRMLETEPSGPGVDTPEDVAAVEKLLAS